MQTMDLNTSFVDRRSAPSKSRQPENPHQTMLRSPLPEELAGLPGVGLHLPKAELQQAKRASNATVSPGSFLMCSRRPKGKNTALPSLLVV